MTSPVQSQAEQAYELLEEKLVTLELPPGAQVSEGRLIELIGLGRTPVREAIQRLAQQELLQVLPRKGLTHAKGKSLRSVRPRENCREGTPLASYPRFRFRFLVLS